MAFTVDGSNGLTFPDSTTMASATQLGLRNRIINGAMMIDQRNAGASVSPGAYTLDRWYCDQSAASKYTVQQNSGSVTPPAGFTNYLGAVSSSAYSIGAGDYFTIQQYIEGLNVYDLAWGTASAKTVTLSFWVRSSLTGTFGGALKNSAENRSYPFSYSISSANTWEYKTITIPGDTSGTWLTTNGKGVSLFFSLGVGATYSGAAGAWAGTNYASATGATSVVGTNGATFYITGVQFERGSAASPFDWRPYPVEFSLCQRYTTKLDHLSLLHARTSAQLETSIMFPVVMRTAPTISPIAAYNCFDAFGNSFTQSASDATYAVNGATAKGAFIDLANFSGLTQGRTYVTNAGSSGGVLFSAEL